MNSFIHLTNYSVQKYNDDFSKKEIGNEISFNTFQSFLNKSNIKYSVKDNLVPELKNIIAISMKSVKYKINMKNRKHCYELFGYDFILDKNLKPYLLEVNTNPGLDESSPLIEQLVPRMIEDSIRLTLNDLFEIPDEPARNKVDGYDNKTNLFEFICKL